MGGTGSTPPVRTTLLPEATEMFCEATYVPPPATLPIALVFPWVAAAKAAGEIKTVS